MTYSLEFDLGGTRFAITHPDLNDLLEEYGRMGGDAASLRVQIKGAVNGTEHAPATQEPARPAETKSSAWDDDGPWKSSEPSGARSRKDPWDDAPVGDRPSGARSAPSRATQPDGDVEQATDKFGRVWTTGLPDAPVCECGLPAARMKGKSQAGKPYTVFKCAKGAPGGDWRSKCEFSEFPPR
jgi:hypothetical protein